MPRLSCCLIAWNEATDPPRWLPSTARLDSELIVVDTGSTDRTPEITAEFGARVLNHVWRKDVSAARNVGLDAATDDWILSLDTDDELPPDTIVALPELLARADGPEAIDGFTMIYRSFMPPDQASSGEWRSGCAISAPMACVSGLLPSGPVETRSGRAPWPPPPSGSSRRKRGYSCRWHRR